MMTAGALSLRGAMSRKKLFSRSRGPLHYTLELGSMMTIISSRKNHHLKVRKDAVQFRREWSVNGNVLSHINYEEHGKVSTRRP